MVGVRPATEDDLDAVVELAQELHRLHHAAEPDAYTAQVQPRDKFARALGDDERLLLVAVTEERVVGYAYAREVLRAGDDYTLDARFVEVDEVMTLPGARRQGCARALLEGVQEWARTRGARELCLSVRAPNRDAIEAYQALGFRFSSHRMRRTF